MGDAKDPSALEKYKAVLKLAKFTGYIEWRLLPLGWIAEHLTDVDARDVNELMAGHVQAGGKIDQVEERRAEYLDFRFHYDFRLKIGERRVYIETILDEREDAEDCTIWVVNIHDA
ncbi:MAG: hypothetical protein WD768_21855 [Phycisphaeraceae bacterium]